MSKIRKKRKKYSKELRLMAAEDYLSGGEISSFFVERAIGSHGDPCCASPP